MKIKQFLALSLLATAALPAMADGSVTADSDNWALTDALGRTARSYDTAGDRNEGRYVGIFYWTWHQANDAQNGMDDTTIEVKNITEVLREHPEAINEYYHPAWAGANGKRPGVFYWDRPIFGYYKTTDPWVLRKHAEMLADAGIDCIFMDCTNGSLIWEASFWQLLETWSQAEKDGVKVPKIVFLLPFAATNDSKKSLNNLYTKLYQPGKYQNLWFYWKGKPLILAHNTNLANTGVEGEIRKFFTFRGGQPDYVNGASLAEQKWGWLEVYPNHPYTIDFQTMGYEETPVGVAQNARDASGGHCCAFTLPNTYGRSYSKLKGFDPRPDGYLYGWNFQEQWDRAIDEIKPQMIFVTGWNEWTSGMWNSSHGWSDPLSFVDQFDWDHSRDCEPTTGWGDKGDVYYQQLVDNVRRFKGMDIPQTYSEPKTIVIGKEGEWDDVLPRYKAYRGNTFHRDHPGRYNAYYTDNSGRNDICGAQTTHDADNVYFRVETAEALTPSTDKNWMMLFIDVDRNKATGWTGYDFIVNRVSPTSDKVCIERCDGSEWAWTQVGTAPYALGTNSLEIAIPKSLLGLDEEVDIEFKWNDNMQDEGNPLDFYISGDTAPGGRFNYVFTSSLPSGVEAFESPEAELKASARLGGISIETDRPYHVYRADGALLAKGGAGVSSVDTVPGVYIVTSGARTAKVVVNQ